jgi:hypothetical protein
MPQSLPAAPTLIAAAVKYLEDELMPTLAGYHRFKTRVTINVLNTVRRELEMRPALETAEGARLAALVRHEGEAEELSRELCDLIRAGGIDLNDRALRAHLRQSLEDALAINNPKWKVSS